MDCICIVFVYQYLAAEFITYQKHPPVSREGVVKRCGLSRGGPLRSAPARARSVLADLVGRGEWSAIGELCLIGVIVVIRDSVTNGGGSE